MATQAAKMAAESESIESDEKFVHLSDPVDQQDIAKLAYEFWEARGCPDGSPEEDWLRAERELQSRM